jgi:hypothetical protein
MGIHTEQIYTGRKKEKKKLQMQSWGYKCYKAILPNPSGHKMQQISTFLLIKKNRQLSIHFNMAINNQSASSEMSCALKAALNASTSASSSPFD